MWIYIFKEIMQEKKKSFSEQTFDFAFEGGYI